jgi:tripartite-type tricarboxylate transporter receptor subunit TctC
VKLVVPYPPGGGADFLARLLAEKAQAKWGQTVIVENRSGAGGNVGTESVFRANPDGYTLLFTAQPPLVANKSLYAKLNFDPDIMTPVSIMTTGYSVLMVHPKLPVNSVAELIAYAKANPNKLNYASQGIGNAAHLSAYSLQRHGPGVGRCLVRSGRGLFWRIGHLRRACAGGQAQAAGRGR